MERATEPLAEETKEQQMPQVPEDAVSRSEVRGKEGTGLGGSPGALLQVVTDTGAARS